MKEDKRAGEKKGQ